MSDDLLRYYAAELAELREGARRFAEKYPDVAGQLRISADALDDPHVQRLLEGAAFLNARLNKKLDDEFPLFLESLLDIIHPHYTRPVPATAIVQFVPDPEFPAAQLIPRGATVDTQGAPNGQCRFRTCYDVELQPIAVRNVALMSDLSSVRGADLARNVQSVLTIALGVTADGLTFSRVAPRKIRFFIRMQTAQAHALHRLIAGEVAGALISDGARAVAIPQGAVRLVGFGRDETILNAAVNAKPEYALLSEAFLFPEKFLFFDVELSGADFSAFGNHLVLHVLLGKGDAALESAVGPASLVLGCTPVANLFNMRAEPILASGAQSEYRVVADLRRQRELEVYSVETVEMSDSNGRRIDVQRLFQPREGAASHNGAIAWSMRRRPSTDHAGTEVFLSLANLGAQVGGDERVLSAQVVCTNRDLPRLLPYGADQPRLALVEPFDGVQKAICLSPPTPPFWPSNTKDFEWRLTSHLILNHSSLLGPKALESFKAILELQNLRGSDEIRRMIGSLHAMTVTRSVSRAPKRPGDCAWGDALCRGFDIDLTIDAERFRSNTMHLFITVLDHFFGLYTSLNSFTRLRTSFKGQPESDRTWPARSGAHPLL